MYIYLDSNAVVKEIINDGTIRQGNTQNKVYVYFDSEITIKGCSLALRKNNQGYVIPCSTFDGSLTTSITIPYNKNRDLKYFKEEYPYQMYEFILDADFLANAGTCDAVVQFVLADNDILFTSGVIAFIVADNNLSIDVDITLAQLNALANRITSAEIGGDGNFYTETEVDALLNLKQDKLEAGEGVNIENDVVSVDTSTIATKEELEEAEGQITTLQMEKQDTLVSGTTIKTYKGQSLLGSGDIKPREWYYTTSALSWTLQSTTTIELSNLYFISGSSSGVQGTTRIPNVGDFVFYNRGIIGVVQSVNTSVEPYRATIITKWISGAEWTCLEEGTLIRLANGEEKPIEEIKKGDLLLGYDFENNAVIPCVCLLNQQTEYTEQKTCLVFSNNSVLFTSEHHDIYCVETGKNEDVADLKEGNHVLDENGNEVEIYTIHRNLHDFARSQFYQIITSNNTYFASGILNALHPITKANWVRYADHKELDPDLLEIYKADANEYMGYVELYKNKEFLAQSVALTKEIKTRENTIAQDKKYLSDTDYIAIKRSEGCIDVDENIIIARQNARDEINACESEIATYQNELNALLVANSPIGSDILLPESERQAKYFKIACKRDNDNLQLFIDKYTSIK